ncbi:MAG: hypothetical protein AAFY57_12850 [Cyanobacteria bacterium J06642_2]
MAKVKLCNIHILPDRILPAKSSSPPFVEFRTDALEIESKYRFELLPC